MSGRSAQPDEGNVSTGFKDIPCTNATRTVDAYASVPDASSSAASDNATTRAVGVLSSATEFQEIPGTNIPRKTQEADVVAPASLALGGSSVGGGFAVFLGLFV